jgi:chemotaxis protein methyltransferase CheR
MPADLIDAAFDKTGTNHLLKQAFKEGITFLKQDLRKSMPKGPFHLILCRNLAFTYYDDLLQLELLEKMTAKLIPGGFLVIGAHEKLPLLCSGMVVSPMSRCIFQLNACRPRRPSKPESGT